MGRQKTPEELSEALSFFPPGSVRAVNRLLKRAAEKQAREARSGVRTSKATRTGTSIGEALGGTLAKQLSKALRQRGATKREQPSVKQKGPEGGRPFHFAHSTVNKDDAPPAAPQAGGKATTKAAAHMKYIERELAVERTFGVERDDGARGVGGARLRDPGSPTLASIRERDSEEAKAEAMRGTDAMSSARAAQGYIENPVKLANGENIVFSFGTIGDRFEDRVAFWEKLEEAERKNARVQSRLIVELPHEAPPTARFEIVRDFCKRFEEMGLPYWAALHAPGKNNDSRNFHAHIVYSESPAARMVDPKDGVTKWDFECKDTYKTSSRNTIEHRPYRQNQHPFFRPKTAIKTLRQQFEQDANAVLTRHDVRDGTGAAVTYDARSYKDMSLDVVPMKSVDRIVADKMRSGQLTVLDRDFTKKMIRAELKEALARRDRNMLDLVRLDQALEKLAKEPRKPRAQNKAPPREMRVSALAQLTGKAVRAAASRVLDAKRAALSDDLMERSTRSSLSRIIEATDAKTIAASARNTRDPVRRAELPDEEAARLLNAAAREELELLDGESKVRRQRSRYGLGLALNGWRDVVGPRTPETSAIMAAAIEQAQAPTPVRDASRDAPSRAPPAPAGVQVVRSFAERVHLAHAATTMIFAQIATLPSLEDRLAAIDRLGPKLPTGALAEQRREGVLKLVPRDLETGREGGQGAPSGGVGTTVTRETERPHAADAAAPIATPGQDAAPTREAATSTPTEPSRPAVEVAPLTAEEQDEAERRKRERKRRKRRAVLAKRGRDGDRGR